MTQILERWQSLKDLGMVAEDNEKRWVFRERLESQHGRFFKPFVFDLPLLTLEYRALSTRILRDLSKRAETPESFQLTPKDIDQLLSALVIVEVLDLIYHEFIDNPAEAGRLHADKKRLRAYLRMDRFEFARKKSINNLEPASFQVVREQTAMFNWLRLFMVRGRRFFITLIPVIKASKQYAAVIQAIDKYLGPALNYVAWIFYIPRLLVNLIELIVHVPGWAWMNTKEKQIGWTTRLKSQLDRNGFDLGNDIAWFVGGVLGCFTLIGPLAPIGFMLTVAIFAFDFVMAITRGLIDGLRMVAVEADYQQRYLNAQNDEERQLIGAEIDALILHTDNDRQRIYSRLVNTGLILLGMGVALPLIAALCSAIPFAGAGLIILVTISIYLLGKWLDAKTPTDRPARLPKINHRFFHPEPTSDLEDNIPGDEPDYYPDNASSSGDESKKMLG